MDGWVLPIHEFELVREGGMGGGERSLEKGG